MNLFKKIMAISLVAVLFITAACSEEAISSEETPLSVEQTPQPRVVTQSTPEPKTTENLLTGLDTLSDEAVGKRPVAVMVNNLMGALPQYGVSDADVIFEIPVEADITRLMAIYGDYTKVPKIASIRSCRYYYPIIAVGFDAYYIHIGKDATIAAATLNSLDIDNWDGGDGFLDGVFGRDQDRINAGYDYEHTAYFDGGLFFDYLKESTVRTDLKAEKSESFFNFNNFRTAPNGSGYAEFTVNFGSSYYSTFTYNSEDMLYYKQHSGYPHMDSATDKQLAFTNVIVLETDISVRDDKGRKNVSWQGGANYNGYYFSDGVMERITWEKSDEYANFEFFDKNGKPLAINKGKTYIALTYPDIINLNS